MVEEAYPPSPLVSSHSRPRAASRSRQVSWPKLIILRSLRRAAAPLRSDCGLGRGDGHALALATLLQHLRDEPGPAGLVIRSHAPAGVAVEVLEEQDQVAPVRIGLEFLPIAIHRPASLLVAQKSTVQPARQLPRDFP